MTIITNFGNIKYEAKTVKTRKIHTCFLCFIIIPKGSTVQRNKVYPNGNRDSYNGPVEMTTFYFCGHCK